jgi:hypothetical protein
MKKILYTVCSANHLAHCKTMIDSFIEYHTDYRIMIGLVDKVDQRFDVSDFRPAQILEVANLSIPGFAQMATQYSVIELNCAMKVFVAQYLFATEQPDILLYLDADMLVFQSFTAVEEALLSNELLLTPHFYTPLPDNLHTPLERDILRSGIYNAGFIAMKQSYMVTKFLAWWAGHMQAECYYQFAEGMGVDQVWMNLVPILFPGTGILQHPGANVAYWNLHERELSMVENKVMVNNEFPLLFLHISGYHFDQPDRLSRHQNRFLLSNFPLLASLLGQYREKVIQNGYEVFHALPCMYAKAPKQSTGIMRLVNGLIKPLGIKISSR